MSASGTYSYWPKVNNPNTQFIQMTSGEYQPPFFFGGSQIPHALGIMNGSGLDQPRIPEGRPRYTVRPIYKDEWNNEIRGRGIDNQLLAVSDHNEKIYIPKHLSTLYK